MQDKELKLEVLKKIMNSMDDRIAGGLPKKGKALVIEKKEVIMPKKDSMEMENEGSDEDVAMEDQERQKEFEEESQTHSELPPELIKQLVEDHMKKEESDEMSGEADDSEEEDNYGMNPRLAKLFGKKL